MAKYTLRAVVRQRDGRVTNIADTWPLIALNLDDAKAEADRQKWYQTRELANAFEIADQSGRVVTSRPFRKEGEDASWS